MQITGVIIKGHKYKHKYNKHKYNCNEILDGFDSFIDLLGGNDENDNAENDFSSLLA